MLTASLLPDPNFLSMEAHGDAVWDICWTAKDNAVVSISADGVIKRWNSTSGQVMRSAPPHTLGLVSLSVSPDGGHALYNSVDGTTFLSDLESGEIVGKHESYTRSAGEPCESLWPVHPTLVYH
jgi:WD repeat-containing protein 61